MIPYGRQEIDADDISAVVAVLQSDFLTQGPTVPLFEKAVAGRCGVDHAVAVNSATSALHIACLALGVGPGDRVWTSPNTFVASANCARYCGAAVDFVDIDPVSRNLCPNELARKLERAAKSGQLPKVVIPVHFAGLPCELGAIRSLADQYNFKIVEDASHAIGATFEGSTIGDCRFSDITVFSFHPVKIVTTAEGGMATTKSASLARKMQLLRSHGITRESVELSKDSDCPWYYEQHLLGFNYRLTDVQAALGVSQLRHLDDWIQKRHAIADVYDRELASLPLKLPLRPSHARSALHLYVVELDTSNTTVDRKAAFVRLRASGVGVNVHYYPVHMQPYYVAQGFERGQFPTSETYYERCMSIPMFPALDDEMQSKVIGALRGVFA